MLSDSEAGLNEIKDREDFRPVAPVVLEALVRKCGVPPRVSVVVPTYRHPRMLARCLAALVAQSLTPHAYEIIVCDDGCARQTCEIVPGYSARLRPLGYRIVYVPICETQGPAATRNRGWRIARGHVVAFTDDDTVQHASWLEQRLAARRCRASAVAGRIPFPFPKRASIHRMSVLPPVRYRDPDGAWARRRLRHRGRALRKTTRDAGARATARRARVSRVARRCPCPGTRRGRSRPTS